MTASITERYSRQTLLPQVRAEGQKLLAEGSVAIAGCGALGAASASLLVRAGVGRVRLIDRDFVEISNLQRQCLYTEADVESGMPKAAVATERLRAANSLVDIETCVADLTTVNAEELLTGVDVVIDAIDNFEGRFLINDVALKHSIPWVYGAVIGTYGLCMTMLPGEGPCLRCLLPEPPAPGTVDTCATAGIFGPVVDFIAAAQATEALKLLLGKRDELRVGLTQMEMWDGEMTMLDIPRRDDCPACQHGERDYLDAAATSETVSLCGQNALQISMPDGLPTSLSDLAERLRASVSVKETPFMIRFEVEGHEVNVFGDGRAIIKGTTDPAAGRMLYSKYVGA